MTSASKAHPIDPGTLLGSSEDRTVVRLLTLLTSVGRADQAHPRIRRWGIPLLCAALGLQPLLEYTASAPALPVPLLLLAGIDARGDYLPLTLAALFGESQLIVEGTIDRVDAESFTVRPTEVFAGSIGTAPLRVSRIRNRNGRSARNTGLKSTISGIAAHLVMQVFQLASHYNEVDLDQPGHARFLQHVHVRCGDSAEATLVGAMTQTA